MLLIGFICVLLFNVVVYIFKDIWFDFNYNFIFVILKCKIKMVLFYFLVIVFWYE